MQVSRQQLHSPFPWSAYSRKLVQKIMRPRSAGSYSREDANNRKMHLAVGSAGSIDDGNALRFYWLVDPDDGVIVDAKFQAYGQSALLGAAEALCGILLGKNYDQATRISAELIDQQLRDRADTPAFPKETAAHVNLALEAIDNAASHCKGIPLASAYVAPPVTFDRSRLTQEGGYPNWESLDKPQKMAVIEDVIAREIRPYIELDGGGVEVLDFLNNREIIVAYKGNCTSCFSATGATLSYMQQTIQALVNKDLIVVPEM